MSNGYLLLSRAEGSAGDGEGWARIEADLPARGWRRGLTRPGLRLWLLGDRPPPTAWRSVEGALIIGRRRSRTAVSISPAAPIAARAAALIEGGWGSYVAVLQDADRAWWALRDPSGAMDALTWRRGDVRLLASGLQPVPPALWPADIALDWGVIAEQLGVPESLAARCALRGVHAIIPGDLQRFGAAESLAIWRPPVPSDPEPGAAAARLREAVCEAVQGLAAGHARLLLEVSGGLDSAIVAGALAAGGLAGRVGLAVHYVGDRRESREQVWAEAVARRCGLPLEAAAREISEIDPERDFVPWAGEARPPVTGLDAWRDRDLAARMAASGASAVMTGMGGDAVFFQMATPLVVADLVRARGWRALRDPVVVDTARWLRRSVWSVGAEALRAARAAPPAAGATHPWLEAVAAAAPGSRMQTRGLLAVNRGPGHNHRTAVGEVLHPLMSQPVMEACLGLPSWVLTRGGRDRALARCAFSDLLPASVASRASKGGLTSLFSRRVAASLPLLRPYLLDGVLVEAGLLDRAAVDKALTPERLIWNAEGVGLITAAALEAWVRHWQARIPDAAPRRALGPA